MLMNRPDFCAGHRERTLEVRVDDRVPLLLGHVEDHAVAEDAGVVHDDVDASERLHSGVDNALAARHRRDGIVVRDGLAPRRADLRHDVVGRRARAATPRLAPAVVVHDHTRPVLREQQRDLPPDPARRAGDHDRLVLQHHRAPPILSVETPRHLNTPRRASRLRPPDYLHGWALRVRRPGVPGFFMMKRSRTRTCAQSLASARRATVRGARERGGVPFDVENRERNFQ
jgi:hypothetical protein